MAAVVILQLYLLYRSSSSYKLELVCSNVNH
jgi:hypothetical protein